MTPRIAGGKMRSSVLTEPRKRTASRKQYGLEDDRGAPGPRTEAHMSRRTSGAVTHRDATERRAAEIREPGRHGDPLLVDGPIGKKWLSGCHGLTAGLPRAGATSGWARPSRLDCALVIVPTRCSMAPKSKDCGLSLAGTCSARFHGSVRTTSTPPLR
jgi:hypothetical protein